MNKYFIILLSVLCFTDLVAQPNKDMAANLRLYCEYKCRTSLSMMMEVEYYKQLKAVEDLELIKKAITIKSKSLVNELKNNTKQLNNLRIKFENYYEHFKTLTENEIKNETENLREKFADMETEYIKLTNESGEIQRQMRIWKNVYTMFENAEKRWYIEEFKVYDFVMILEEFKVQLKKYKHLIEF